MRKIVLLVLCSAYFIGCSSAGLRTITSDSTGKETVIDYTNTFDSGTLLLADGIGLDIFLDLPNEYISPGIYQLQQSVRALRKSDIDSRGLFKVFAHNMTADSHILAITYMVCDGYYIWPTETKLKPNSTKKISQRRMVFVNFRTEFNCQFDYSVDGNASSKSLTIQRKVKSQGAS